MQATIMMALQGNNLYKHSADSKIVGHTTHAGSAAFDTMASTISSHDSIGVPEYFRGFK